MGKTAANLGTMSATASRIHCGVDRVGTDFKNDRLAIVRSSSPPTSNCLRFSATLPFWQRDPFPPPGVRDVRFPARFQFCTSG